MHAYTDTVKSNWSEYHQSYKWPRLDEVFDFLSLDYDETETSVKNVFNIDSETVDFHDARLDVVVTMEVYKAYEVVHKVEYSNDITFKKITFKKR